MFEKLFGRIRAPQAEIDPWPELNDHKGLDPLSPKDIRRLKEAQVRLEEGAFSVERTDVPGYQKTFLLRSQKSLLFCGITDEGQRVSWSSEMRKRYRKDDKDLTLEAIAAFDAHEKGQKDPSGLLRDITKDDWLFAPHNTSTSIIIDEQATQAMKMAGVKPHHATDMAFFMAASKRFDKTLDPIQAEVIKLQSPEVRDLIENKRISPKQESLAWLTAPGREIETPNGPKYIEPRKDAVKQIAWIGDGLASTYDGPLERLSGGGAQRHELTKAIDEGGSVVDLTAKALEVRRATIMHFKDVPAEHISKGGPFFIMNLQDLDKIPNPKQISTDPQGIRDALQVVLAQEYYQLATGNPDGIKQSGANVGQVFKSLRGEAPHGLEDMNSYLRDRLLIPAFWQIEKARGLSDDDAALEARAHAKDHPFLKNHTLTTAYKANADWHKRLSGINSRTQEMHAIQGWSAYRGDVDLGEGITAHEVRTTSGLKSEGDTQGHCVGGYTDQVLEGKCLIYSLRRGDEILSTVEIGTGHAPYPKLTPDMRIRQNHGKNNEDASKEAQMAAGRLLQDLRSQDPERLEIYHKSLTQALEARAKRSEFEVLCAETAGYDVSKPEKVAGVFKEVSNFLPKVDTAQGFEAWARQEYARASGRQTAAPAARLDAVR